jgi:hypothetical protein
VKRAIAHAAGALAFAGVCAALLAAWLAPDTVMALWRLAAWCG